MYIYIYTIKNKPYSYSIYYGSSKELRGSSEKGFPRWTRTVLGHGDMVNGGSTWRTTWVFTMKETGYNRLKPMNKHTKKTMEKHHAVNG